MRLIVLYGQVMSNMDRIQDIIQTRRFNAELNRHCSPHPSIRAKEIVIFQSPRPAPVLLQITM